MSHAALPDDIETLKRLVIGRDEMIAKLMAEIARLKRWRFGRSAERMDAALVQLQLLLGDLQAPAASELPVQETVPVEESTQSPPLQQRVTRLRRVPRALPAHLPRETIVHTPASCSCPECGTQMRKLGEDISEMLDYVPGYFKVLRHVRPKFSCGHCAAIIQLPAPSRPIDRGLPAPGLLAQVIVSKYGDHCPLYRQQGIYRRSGVDLDRATLAEWVGGASRFRAVVCEWGHCRGCVLGACAAQVLRSLRGGSLADRDRGVTTYRRAVRDRAGDSRQRPGAASLGAAATRWTAARCVAPVAVGDAADSIGEVGARWRHQVFAGALDRADPVSG